MGQAHISEDHKSRGIQALSLQANNCDRLQTDTVVLALAARLPFWTCLSTLHIRLQPIAGECRREWEIVSLCFEPSQPLGIISGLQGM